MPVHLFGFTPDMDKVTAFAKKHNLLIIEDAAQALGIKWNGKGCGSLGDVGCFSFFADKTLTTAEGGFVTTNDDEIYDNLLFLRNQGRRGRGTFVHPRIGYNFRMTDIQCAIGLAQLKKFDRLVEKKNKIHQRYTEAFSGFEHVDIYQPPEQVSPFVPFRVILRTKSDEADQLMEHMRTKAFELWADDPRHHPSNFPMSSKSYDNGICLPSFVAISDEQLDHVCKTIKEYYG